MKTKTAILTFVALSLSLALFSSTVFAYDANGTWHFVGTNGRSECSMTGPKGAEGTITITQYGNLVDIKWSPYGKDQFTFSGGVAGSRYQAFGAWYSSSFPIYATLVFDLKSACYGKGYWLNTTDHTCYDSCNYPWRQSSKIRKKTSAIS